MIQTTKDLMSYHRGLADGLQRVRQARIDSQVCYK